jgi:osmotically-inducible protein OsmY
MPSDTDRGPERREDTVRHPSRVDPATGDRIERGERFVEPRSWWDRTSDEVQSWFGDADAARRRQLDEAAGDHAGKGPKTYKRPDQRILEDVSERLAASHDLDASGIVITVDNGEVTLDGTVSIRADKHLAEDIAESARGVTHVQNNLRVGEGV